MANTKTLILTATYPADFSPPDSSHHDGPRRRIVSALHIGGLLASLTATALFSAAIPKWNANFFHNTGPSSADWTDGMPLGPLAFAFLYHATVLIHARIRSSRRRSSMQRSMSSPSPRCIFVHVTVLILTLLSLVPALFLAGYGALFQVWRPAVRTRSGVLVCDMANVFARECEPVLYTIGTLQIGGVVFGALAGTIQLALLLDALRRLRRHRLVKQLQREKLAHYGAHEDHPTTNRFRTRTRRHRGRHVSSPRSEELPGQQHVPYHQHQHQHDTDHHHPSPPHQLPPGQTSMTAAASTPTTHSVGGNASGAPSYPQQRLDQPLYFLRLPEQSHAAVSSSRRHG